MSDTCGQIKVISLEKSEVPIVKNTLTPIRLARVFTDNLYGVLSTDFFHTDEGLYTRKVYLFLTIDTTLFPSEIAFSYPLNFLRAQLRRVYGLKRLV